MTDRPNSLNGDEVRAFIRKYNELPVYKECAEEFEEAIPNADKFPSNDYGLGNFVMIEGKYQDPWRGTYNAHALVFYVVSDVADFVSQSSSGKIEDHLESNLEFAQLGGPGLAPFEMMFMEHVKVNQIVEGISENRIKVYSADEARTFLTDFVDKARERFC